MTDIDWLEIWNRVSASTRHADEREKQERGRKHFRKDAPHRNDPLLDFVLEGLKHHETVLDIGAGNGRWTIPIARKVKAVTAIEPSDSMLEMLSEKIEAETIDTIHVIQARWEQAEIEPHDIVVCVHAMYETPDFAGFIRKIEQHATSRVYLVLRLPPHDGIMSELNRAVHGNSHDSPNAVIAWNALYSLGIYPNLLVEPDMHHWQDTTLNEAFLRAKRHLNAESTTKYDELIKNTLEKRLSQSGNSYIWPDGMRSALLWWETGRQEKNEITNVMSF